VIDPAPIGAEGGESLALDATPIEAWPDRLEAVCTGLRFLRRAVVVRETGSTQDLARGRAEGDVVVAWRQTSGRGRDGRTWADTGLGGVAVTAVAAVHGPWIALAAGVAAAEAIERVAPSIAVGLKWPNDLMIAGRKVGGVLIERDGDASLIGIGINVSQPSFDGELATRATSLAIAGACVDRLVLLEALLPRLDHWLAAGESPTIGAFQQRDMLRGRVVRLSAAGAIVEGVVDSIDPLVAIRIRTPAGLLAVGASTARIESFT
jgi:BirA family biotin operon repressor/biotin-[acetyl-CoA-carboxylase] ligase